MSLLVELPGLYLDAIADVDTVGISVENTIPEADSVDAAVDTNVQLDVISTDAAIVDEAETQVWVNDVLAFDGGTFQTGFDGPGSTADCLPVIGPEHLADGDMEADLPGPWVIHNNAQLSKETSDPYQGTRFLRVAYNGTAYPAAKQSVLVKDLTYRITGVMRGDGTNTPRIQREGGIDVFIGTSSTTWQPFAVEFTATVAGNLYFRPWITGSGHADFDNVSLTPVLTDLVVDGDMEAGGTASWVIHNSATLSKVAGSPGGSGTQVLRVTYGGSPFPGAKQSMIVAGRVYCISGWGRGDGTNVWRVQKEGGTDVFVGTASTDWQPIRAVFTATSSGFIYLRPWAAGACWAEFDDIKVEEVHDYRIIIDPTSDFDSEELVTVRVVSETDGGSYTVDYTYSFTIEDTVQPQLLSARATGPFTVQLTFSEPMLAASASGEHDALNPSLYAFEYVPESDRIAAVYVNPVSVAEVSDAVFDVTLDMEPTFWKTYRVTCGEIADDSSNANLLNYNARTADFASWYPPYWPERRRFDLWSQLSDDDQASDAEFGDLRRLISVEQDIVDVLLWDIDAEQWYRDIDKAPEWAVDAMLIEMGNPFSLDLTLERKRKLLSVLPEIYQEKGTDEGIVDVARFFLGITITSVTEINIDTWVLGESELGVDTDLGPSGEAELYTFWLNVDRVLTDQERRDLATLVDYMKPAHTHYRIIEPTDPEFVDHVELGLSELGFNFDLHE
jgi:phage tail-like protein